MPVPVREGRGIFRREGPLLAGAAAVMALAGAAFFLRGHGAGPNPLSGALLVPGALGLGATLVAIALRRKRQAEKREAESRHNVRELLDAAFDGIVLHADGRILDFNAAVETLFGHPAEALRGMAMDRLLGRDGGDGSWALMPEGGAVEARVLRADGETLHVELLTRPYSYRGRKAAVTTVRDISARKRSEEALRKSEEHLRTVISNSPLVIFAFDRRGVITLAEGKGLETLGLEPVDLVGAPAWERLGRVPHLRENMDKALGGEPVTAVLKLSGKVFETHCRPLRDAGGEVAEVIGVAMDVTSRVSAEEELRKSRENLAAVISNAPIVLFALNRKGVFTLSEGKGLEELGLRPGEAVGMVASDLFPDMPVILDNLERALAGERFTSVVEYKGRVFQTHYHPVFKGYGELDGVIGVGMDITERKLAEDALRRSEEHLQQIQKMEAIGRVAGGVAHDFNNLLTTITGYCDMLAGSLSQADPRYKNISSIITAADKATTLTRQLLAFSRNQILNPKVLNLNEVVKEADRLVRRLVREDVELVTMLEPQLKPVKADPSQMEQVILNLSMNARDAMPRGGQLSLETANVWLDGVFARRELNLTPGPYVMLGVSDTGVGMDEETRRHIFEPFFTTKAQGAGSGLGLATVYGIVKQSGGNVWVESSPGQGTSFRIYLPQFVPVDSDAPVPAPINRRARSGLATVLLVEDEEAVRTLIREILSMHGFTVLEARQGGEAVLISERFEGFIDLLLTDVVMENMSGRQLADRLHPMRPEMRVLYISGYNNELDLGRGGQALDGRAFLAKPFTPKTLVMKVREVLDSHSAPVPRPQGVSKS